MLCILHERMRLSDLVIYISIKSLDQEEDNSH